MKNCIYFIILSTFSLSCSNTNSKDLEIENAKLKLKIYEDSLKKLSKISEEIENKSIQSIDKDHLNSQEKKIVQEKDSYANERLTWLCKNATVIFP